LSSFFSELGRRNVIRVAALYLVSAWLIAQVADVVIGLGELPSSIGRVVLVVLAIGFPVALGLAWVFEWTPSGLRREVAVEDSPAVGTSHGRHLDFVIIALLSVALVYFAATHDWQRTPALASASIAVLPFENRSASPDDLYFTDGIHDDLLTQLAKISSLVVISRTSVMQYRHTEKTVPQIAGELGVATILEGGVQRAGDRVRVNLQLIEAATDRHLWAETFDRELTAENVFAIQSEIAAAIAETLHAKLLPDEQRRLESVPTRNLEAYDAYLLGRRDTATRDQDAMLRAETYFERAIELDPQFALAYSSLAEVRVLLAEWVDQQPGERLEAAEQAARRALELDPSLGEAHTAIGIVLRARGEKPEVYVDFLERGVALAPGSADARKWFGNYLGEVGRDDDALVQLQKAAELEPMSAIVRVNLGNVLEELGRKDEAAASYRKALEIDPTFRPALFELMEAGRPPDRLLELSELWPRARDDAWVMLFIVFDYVTLGDDTRVEQWAREIQHVAPDSIPSLIARLNLALLRNDGEGILRFAPGLVPVEPENIAMPTRLLLQADLRNGDLQAARDRYQGRYPGLLGDDPEIGEDYPAAIDVAMLLREAGDAAGARRLLERSLAYIDSLPVADLDLFGIHRARAQAILGDDEAALATLRLAIDAGWRTQWTFYLLEDRAFDDIRADRRFQALIDDVRADVAAQLEKVREFEASGRIVVPAAAGN